MFFLQNGVRSHSLASGDVLSVWKIHTAYGLVGHKCELISRYGTLRVPKAFGPCSAKAPTLIVGGKRLAIFSVPK